MNVARPCSLDEQYPDFYSCFVEILPTFAWQEEMLEAWAISRRCRVRQEGGNWIADALSEAEEEWLDQHGIRFEKSIYALDVD